jgi:DHA2 family multidrug resistance protein
MNFLRTMAGAVGTAVAMTIWYDGAQEKRAQLSGVLNGAEQTMQSLQMRGYSLEQSRQIISQMVDGQASALATGSIFVTAAIVFAAAASIVWLAPRPKHAVAAGHAH